MNASQFALVASVAGAHFLALLSPGADFALIVKSGMSKPFSRALGVAFGICAANGAYIAVCLAGFGGVVANAPSIIGIIKVLGGCYLMWLGIGGMRSRRTRVEIGGERAGNGAASFLSEARTGFFASILNPKLPLFYLGLFSLVLGQGIAFRVRLGLGIWMAAVVFLWDAFILRVLTDPRVRQGFLRRVNLVDRATGAVLFLLGAGILLSLRA